MIDIDSEVLAYVTKRDDVVPQDAPWWTTSRRLAADRLVGRQALEYVTGPLGSGYRVAKPER